MSSSLEAPHLVVLGDVVVRLFCGPVHCQIALFVGASIGHVFFLDVRCLLPFHSHSFEAGPTLPIGVRDHCTVKINTTAYAIIGGYINEDPNDLTVSID